MGDSSQVTRVRIPMRDLMWLQVDRPENLMYINSLVWFDQVPDWEVLIEVVRERMVDRFPVFRRRAVRRGRTWYWEDHPGFDIRDHITRSRLPEPGGRAEAEAYVSARMGRPLEADRPLWEAECVEGFRREGESGEGAFVLFRVQHSIADGVRLTQLILGLCDAADDSVPPAVGVGIDAHGEGTFGTVGRVGRGIARDSLDLAATTASASWHWPRTAGRLFGAVTAPGGQFTRLPVRVIESLTVLTSEKNTVANTARAVSRMLIEPPSPKLTWSGSPGVQKKASWISYLSLTAIKRAARRQRSTVTAVILAAVSMGLTAYLREHGDRVPADISLMVPVSVAPLEKDDSGELGNHTSLVLFRLPLAVDDPTELLGTITSLMTRVMHSLEAQVGYAVVMAMGAAPRSVTNVAIDFFANKSIGQLTSVPGPRAKVSLAGAPVEGFLGWVPMSGNQSMGICIFSYVDDVNIGFSTDAHLVPDPDRLARLVGEQFASFPGWDDEPEI